MSNLWHRCGLMHASTARTAPWHAIEASSHHVIMILLRITTATCARGTTRSQIITL